MADSQIKLIDYQCQLINYYVIWGTHENPNRGEYDVNTEVLHINNPIKNHARWHKLCFSNLTQLIVGLNSGIKNRNNFFCVGVFSVLFWRYQKFDQILWEFFFTSFYLCEKFSRGCPPTQTPTQTIKGGFAAFSSQEIGSSSVSLEMIFEALHRLSVTLK